MGSEVLQFHTLFLTAPAALLNPLSSPLGRRFPLHNCNSNSIRCFSTSSGGGGNNSRRPKDYYERFSWDDEFRANDKEVEFGFGTAPAKRRIWWSDDPYYEDEDEDDGFDGIGVMESSIGFAWLIKVLRAFGWMLPAIFMSAVLGTGTGMNTIIMALALPLAQSALSLAMDAIWGWSDEGPRSKLKKKKKPYARAASDPGTRSGKRQNTRNGQGVRDYQSWAASNGASNRKQSQSAQNFGGWDELDNHGMERQLKKRLTERPNGPRQWTNGKLSKRIGKRETPVLLRLLIAVFPFLGSWTKLL